MKINLRFGDKTYSMENVKKVIRHRGFILCLHKTVGVSQNSFFYIKYKRWSVTEYYTGCTFSSQPEKTQRKALLSAITIINEKFEEAKQMRKEKRAEWTLNSNFKAQNCKISRFR